MTTIKQKLSKENIPAHVAIIMDGNGRWATKHGHERNKGHQQGVNPVREVVEAASELGVKYLTMYTFSTENWNRPKEEVEALMNLFIATISREVEDLKKNNVRLNAIGNLSLLPLQCQEELQKGVKATQNNTGCTLTLALSYSSKWEIVEAVKNISQQVKEGKLGVKDIDETLFSSYLSTKDMPDPELLIRTSGEYRISNYLLWQLAYSELYFTDTLWPDFQKEDFFKAIYDYQNRERRFGLTSEQIVTS